MPPKRSKRINTENPGSEITELQKEIQFLTEKKSGLKTKLDQASQRNAFLNKIINNVEAAIYINRLTDDGRYERVWQNPQTETKFGAEKGSYKEVESHFQETWHPEHLKFIEESKQMTKQSGKRVYSAVYKKKVRGRWKWIYLIGTIQSYKENGDPDEYLVIGLDFTVRINTDKQLRELLHENLRLKNQLRISKLTRREKEILNLIGEGRTNSEIADVLFISKHTVDTHRKNLLKKLQLSNTAELVHFTTECGLI